MTVRIVLSKHPVFVCSPINSFIQTEYWAQSSRFIGLSWRLTLSSGHFGSPGLREARLYIACTMSYVPLTDKYYLIHNSWSLHV